MCEQLCIANQKMQAGRSFERNQSPIQIGNSASVIGTLRDQD